MEQTNPIRHHVVLVRNSAGTVVHTHEIIDFADVSALSEEELLDKALAAAKRLLGDAHGELRPSVSSTAELDDIHRASFSEGRAQTTS